MTKTYTAHEMRELANKIWDYETMPKGLELCDNDNEQVDCDATQDLIYMLRQAADALEREEERKKMKYEYAAKYNGGYISEVHSDTANGTAYAHDSTDFACVVRREVGEWEEVSNG